MRSLLTLAVAVTLLAAGCKKAMDNVAKDASLGPNEKPKIIDTTGNLTGGSGGAIQATRKAAARTVNMAQLDQLSKSIQTLMTLDPSNKVPTLSAIQQEIRQNGQLMGLINEDVIVLTGFTGADGVWAYTQWPQRANNHYVITRSGVVDMDQAALRQTLQTQKSPIKLSN
jgi:hypothetical protein